MSDPVMLSVVIPVFNAEADLDELIHRCLDACIQTHRPFEIILVDDGSTDRSAEMATAASRAHPDEIVAVLLNRNYGRPDAMLAGFEHVRGDIVVTLAADLQNPPEEIPRLVRTMDLGYDVVGTVRSNRPSPLFRKMASTVASWVAYKTTGVRMHDYGCMLRAYRAHIVDAVLKSNQRGTFIPILANRFSRKSTEIDVRYEARRTNRPKFSLAQAIALLFDLSSAATTNPLRLLGFTGTVLTATGIGLSLFLLFMRLVVGSNGTALMIFTLFAILSIIVGAQCVGLALLGDYLGRLVSNGRTRPGFVIQRMTRDNPGKRVHR